MIGIGLYGNHGVPTTIALTIVPLTSEISLMRPTE
jgi:hypothetical protein